MIKLMRWYDPEKKQCRLALKLAIAVCITAAAILTVDKYGIVWIAFAMWAIAQVAFGFFHAMLSSMRDDDNIDRLSSMSNVDGRSSWIETNTTTGDTREALPIEIPLEVRRWSDSANKWGDDEFEKSGAMLLAIGAIPDAASGADEQRYHVAFTVGNSMTPDLFIEMVDKFEAQMPAIMQARQYRNDGD